MGTELDFSLNVWLHSLVGSESHQLLKRRWVEITVKPEILLPSLRFIQYLPILPLEEKLLMLMIDNAEYLNSR